MTSPRFLSRTPAHICAALLAAFAAPQAQAAGHTFQIPLRGLVVSVGAAPAAPGSGGGTSELPPPLGPGVLSAQYDTFNFGEKAFNSSTTEPISLTNLGPSSVALGSLTVVGDGVFSASSQCPDALPANTSCTLLVTFAPGSAIGTTFQASLSLPSTGANNPLTVGLRGNTPSSVSVAQHPEGYRTWSNGTLAASCLAYRSPPAPYLYSGATGDGVYRISPAGQSAQDVYCDMTSEGGGWTLVMRGNPDQLPTDATWVTNNALNAASLTALAGPSAKHASAYINAIPKSVYRISGVAGSLGPVTRYFGACPLNMTAAPAVGGLCTKSYGDAALSTSTISKYDPKGYNTTAVGLTDYVWVTDSPLTRKITFVLQPTSFWSLGVPANNAFRSTSTTAIGGVSATGTSSFVMYVR